MILALKILRRAKQERGVYALMTISYLATVGLLCMITLWGIAYSTGAYNTLYGATQSAAYSAVSQTVRFENSGGTSTQTQGIGFGCNASSNSQCSSGETFNAAANSVDAALRNGGFGLVYGNTAYFTDRNGNRSDFIYAYVPSSAPGLARAQYQANANNCTPQDAAGQSFLLCWTVEDAVQSGPIFSPGVAVYMAGRVKLCQAAFCPVLNARTAAAATISQSDESQQ